MNREIITFSTRYDFVTAWRMLSRHAKPGVTFREIEPDPDGWHRLEITWTDEAQDTANDAAIREASES